MRFDSKLYVEKVRKASCSKIKILDDRHLACFICREEAQGSQQKQRNKKQGLYNPRHVPGNISKFQKDKIK
jgi:hypothetical protein